MRFKVFIVLTLVIVSCQSNDKKKSSEKSTENNPIDFYKPGLGEFMMGIQMHHAKLWFAGQYQNWDLADFEVHEIRESLDDIRKFCADRPEIEMMDMINGPLDSVISSIQYKDPTLFKKNFTILTNTCNSCHQSSNHGFNVVTIPTAPPVTNQDFKPVNH